MMEQTPGLYLTLMDDGAIRKHLITATGAVIEEESTIMRELILYSEIDYTPYADLMEHLALSRPDISFKFQMGSQVRFHTTGHGDLKEVIYRIYGREVATSLVPIQLEQNGNKVEGYLGKPMLVRSNRNFEIYFINGRFIKSNLIARALEEGYREYLMQHKFPFCVLHITMDPRQVDVNVHPTKMDVRFSNASEVYDFICCSIGAALKVREMIPEALLSEQRPQTPVKIEKGPEPFETKRRENEKNEKNSRRASGALPLRRAVRLLGQRAGAAEGHPLRQRNG